MKLCYEYEHVIFSRKPNGACWSCIPRDKPRGRFGVICWNSRTERYELYEYYEIVVPCGFDAARARWFATILSDVAKFLEVLDKERGDAK